MRNLTLLFLLTLVQLPGISQEVEKKREKKWSKAMQLNTGVSRFYMHNNPEAVQYPTFDMNFRFSAERLLFKRTYLLTGFNYTEKFKRPSYYFLLPGGAPATREATALSHLDFAASGANRRAIAVPVQARFKFFDDKIHLDIGLLFRLWMPYKRENLEPHWVLNGKDEAGLLIAMQKRVGDRLYLGAEVYHGLSGIDFTVVLSSSTPSPLFPSVINQHAQLTATYVIGKK